MPMRRLFLMRLNETIARLHTIIKSHRLEDFGRPGLSRAPGSPLTRTYRDGIAIAAPMRHVGQRWLQAHIRGTRILALFMATFAATTCSLIHMSPGRGCSTGNCRRSADPLADFAFTAMVYVAARTHYRLLGRFGRPQHPGARPTISDLLPAPPERHSGYSFYLASHVRSVDHARNPPAPRRQCVLGSRGRGGAPCMSRLPPMGGRRRRRTESLESGEQADGVEPFAEIDNLRRGGGAARHSLAIRFTVTAFHACIFGPRQATKASPSRPNSGMRRKTCSTKR